MWYCRSLIKTAIRQPFIMACYLYFCGSLLIPVFTNLDVYSINFARNGAVSDEYDYLAIKQAEKVTALISSSESFKTLEKQIELLKLVCHKQAILIKKLNLLFICVIKHLALDSMIMTFII